MIATTTATADTATTAAMAASQTSPPRVDRPPMGDTHPARPQSVSSQVEAVAMEHGNVATQPDMRTRRRRKPATAPVFAAKPEAPLTTLSSADARVLIDRE